MSTFHNMKKIAGQSNLQIAMMHAILMHDPDEKLGLKTKHNSRGPAETAMISQRYFNGSMGFTIKSDRELIAESDPATRPMGLEDDIFTNEDGILIRNAIQIGSKKFKIKQSETVKSKKKRK